MAWIQEKTKEDVERIRDKFLKSGEIVSAGKIEKYVSHRDLRTKKVIYGWQCEVKTK